jgi:hypothetical protein
MAKLDRSGDVQIGVLPYRITSDGEVEVMLLTSRGTGRWVIPKGWPMIGKNPAWSPRLRHVRKLASVVSSVDGLLVRSPIA